jgi:CubicO group peptidase (beta-lactamase class C family)
MMLKEQGLLSYEDKLKKYFPEFPSYTDSITIRHLLTNTSGLLDYYNDLSLGEVLPEVTTKIAIDSLISQDGLKFKPGEKYSSSNSNYLLLALIIEKVSKKTYREFLNDNIFIPLGMNHTYVYDETVTDIPHRVNAYNVFWTKNELDMRHKVIGAGDIYSTVDDLFLFDQALYSNKLVSRETFKTAYDTSGLLNGALPKTKYGFGWLINARHKDNFFIGHPGGIGGFTGLFLRFINKNNTLIILSNYSNSSPDDIKDMNGATMIMMGEPFTFAKISIVASFYNWYKLGFDDAMSKMREVKNDTAKYDFSEGPLNNLGYFFLRYRKEPLLAIEVFKFIVELYPESWNAYDSFAEAYMNAGNKQLAIDNYKKSLKLNPENTNAVEWLKKLKNK